MLDDSVDHGLAGRCVSRCVQWSELSTADVGLGRMMFVPPPDDPLFGRCKSCQKLYGIDTPLADRHGKPSSSFESNM
jgi:hypothetical protein